MKNGSKRDKLSLASKISPKSLDKLSDILYDIKGNRKSPEPNR
jgi:hypothetical protein